MATNDAHGWRKVRVFIGVPVGGVRSPIRLAVTGAASIAAGRS